jgi:hypothetical protein
MNMRHDNGEVGRKKEVRLWSEVSNARTKPPQTEKEGRQRSRNKQGGSSTEIMSRDNIQISENQPSITEIYRVNVKLEMLAPWLAESENGDPNQRDTVAAGLRAQTRPDKVVKKSC